MCSSDLTLKNININPTRNGILIALKKMGAKITYKNKRKINSEEVCDIDVESTNLNGCELESNFSELMIDEYPILAVAASFANSPSVFRGLDELRVKESDRLELINENLQRCGVNSLINENDLIINPSKNYKIKNDQIKTNFDHRIAMSFLILGMASKSSVKIDDSSPISTSFPIFESLMAELGANFQKSEL